MRFLPWFLLLIAASVVGGLAWLMADRAANTAMDHLTAAELQLESAKPNYASAARQLEFGIALAEREGDDRTLQALLETRGRMHRGRGALAAAQADFERLLTLPDYDAVTAYLELAETALLQEELDRVAEFAEQILAEVPDNARAWEILGRAATTRADGLLEDVLEQTSRALPAVDGPRARELVDTIVHTPANSPRRAVLLSDFTALFDGPFEDDLEAIRPRLLQTAEQFAAARAAFTESLGHGVRRNPAYELLDGLLRGADMDAVVDLGMTLRAHRGIASDLRSIQLIARALDAVGRPRAAAQVIEDAIAEDEDAKVGREFLPIWSQILFENETWGRLIPIAGEMATAYFQGAQFERQRLDAAFYRGIGLARVGQGNQGVDFLRQFVNSGRPGPVSDAQPMAWQALAEVERLTKGRGAYQQGLQRVVNADPDYSGDVWLEIADLRTENDALASAILTPLTNAIRLLPERLEELLPRWEEVGQTSLDDSARDLELIASDLRARGQWYQPDSNVYELHQLAQRWKELEEGNGTITVCRRILDQFPEFLPTFDLMIETYLDLGREDLVLPLLLERVQFAPTDMWGLERLREFDRQGLLSPAQRFELMRIDPRSSGLARLAERLLENDRGDVVASAFARPERLELIPGAELIAARAELQRGRPQRASTVLKDVDGSSAVLGEATLLRTRAALDLGKPERLAGVVAKFRPAPEVANVDGASAERAAELMLLAGASDPALELLVKLDGDLRTRSDGVVARRGLAEMTSGRFIEARESLERALAFRDDGFVEFGELLMTVQEERWSDLRRASLVARAALGELDPLENCLLAALEGRDAEALAIATEGELNRVANAPWGLVRAAIQSASGEPVSASPTHGPGALQQTERMVRGTREKPRDPRTTLALLLALQSPDWAPWVGPLLEGARSISGDLWPDYLLALTARQLGDPIGAADRLRALTATNPKFAPAWVQLEELELERLGRIDHPDLLQLRAARAITLGANPTRNPASRLVRADAALQQGSWIEAAEIVTGVLSEDPENVVARLLLARIEDGIGRGSEAVRTFGRFFAEADPEQSFPYVPEFLELLDRVRAAGELSEAAFAAELEALESRHPADPTVVAARASAAIRGAGDNLELGIGRAFRLFEGYRLVEPDAPLEALRPGATRSWFDLIASYDPSRAEELVRGELERLPESIDLWLMLGEAFVLEGHRLEAIDHYERVIQMVPDPTALRALASLIAELGSDHRRTIKLTEEIATLEGIKLEHPSLQLIRARSMVNAGGTLLDAGLEELADLWRRRRGIADQISIAELGRSYGIGMLHRADRDDRGRCRGVLERTLEEIPEGAVDRDVLEVLQSLAPRIPAKQAPKAES